MNYKMKPLQTLATVFLCIVFAMCFTNCSNDDEPNNKSLYGIWAEIENPDHFPILITKDCMIMNDGEDDVFGPSVLLPYLKASYETLEQRFAPND